MENTELTEDGAIELDPEVAKQRQDTYSSLTDLHGIDIFSDEFSEQIERVEQEKEMANTQLKAKVFIEEPEQILDTEEWLVVQLFVGTQERVLNHDYVKKDMGLSVTDIGIVLIAVLAISAVYLFLFGDKKTRRTKR